jgi:histidyl-tRNA synthetase
MFRRERPQKGRYRQFFQIGAEAIGSESPSVDGEVIEMVIDLLRRAGLDGFQLLINSVGDQNCRPQYVALLKEKLLDVASRLCGDCQRRAETNPLRVLDCKVPEDQEIINALPTIQDHLCEPCRTHFSAVKSHLDERGIPYEIRPRMVRGLDYYMRTTFEIVHGSLGAQNSVLGGGRYDGLAESIGSRVHSPGIGFSIGEDRLVMSLEQLAQPKEDPLVIVTFTSGDATRRAAANAAAELRGQGIRVEVAEGKLKKVFEVANKLNARVALICGEDETAAGEISMKDMENQVQVKVRRELLVEKVKECLSKYR